MNMLKQQTVILGVRISRELYKTLREVSRARGEDVSSFVRRAILLELARLSLLPHEQKKALGFKGEEEKRVNGGLR